MQFKWKVSLFDMIAGTDVNADHPIIQDYITVFLIFVIVIVYIPVFVFCFHLPFSIIEHSGVEIFISGFVEQTQHFLYAGNVFYLMQS